jgi:hypothetical protein
MVKKLEVGRQSKEEIDVLIPKAAILRSKAKKKSHFLEETVSETLAKSRT